MKVTFLQALCLTLYIMVGVFGGGLLIGNLCGVIWLLPYFAILIGGGIWFYRYLLEKEKSRCPKYKKK